MVRRARGQCLDFAIQIRSRARDPFLALVGEFYGPKSKLPQFFFSPFGQFVVEFFRQALLLNEIVNSQLHCLSLSC